MKARPYRCSQPMIVSALLILALAISAAAQDSPDSLEVPRAGFLRIYIDCDNCDHDYFRKEITFVDFVRDRLQADVHIQFSTQTTGGGGTEYSVTFKGQQSFAGLDDTLKFVAKESETEDEIRSGQVRIMKLGLIRYTSHTPVAD